MQMLPGDIWAFYKSEASHLGAWPTLENILSLKWAETFLRVNCLEFLAGMWALSFGLLFCFLKQARNIDF